jgi:hypothetical protein
MSGVAIFCGTARLARALVYSRAIAEGDLSQSGAIFDFKEKSVRSIF